MKKKIFFVHRQFSTACHFTRWLKLRKSSLSEKWHKILGLVCLEKAVDSTVKIYSWVKVEQLGTVLFAVPTVNDDLFPTSVFCQPHFYTNYHPLTLFWKITVNQKQLWAKFDFRFNYWERIVEITHTGLGEIIN